MSQSALATTPFNSLSKFTEALFQCPLCLYYCKVNPQKDTMKYRQITTNILHFKTQHLYNTSVHTIVIEYDNFSYSKIVSSNDNQSKSESDPLFSLFHLVNLSEYKTFRDRILELECNNNDLIANFKVKLDILESNYNQKSAEIQQRDNSNFMLNVQNTMLEQELHVIRDEFIASIQNELDELKSANFQQYLNILSNQIELTTTLTNNSILKGELTSAREIITKLENKIVLLTNEKEQFLNSGRANDSLRPDPKLIELLDNERKQKRKAVIEKKELEVKYKELETKVLALESKYQLQADSEQETQTIHELTMSYEKKISELTLLLADKSDNFEKQTTKTAGPTSDRQFRMIVADDFLSLQRKFSEKKFDIMLSFYNTESLDKQLRNAFEKFFSQLITHTNDSGRILLNDPEFSLFNEIREINVRNKFSEDQYKAGLEIQALNIVFSELCRYVFAIIKSVKASMEGNSFKIVPDDASNLILIKSEVSGENISFTIPFFNDMNYSDSFRVFRPLSELYKHSFVFIAFDDEIYLTNNNYQLIPHKSSLSKSVLVVEIPNFFDHESFQVGYYEENNCLIIQTLNFKDNFNLLREIAQAKVDNQ